ncbi:MAG: DPP IV N-terminal domain-containing protein [Prevotella sp.]|nr:DPP IV N-terminal domain-containing protein [Prevotella sp.]
MKLKNIITTMALATTIGTTAQDLKQFTLEDLNFGGTNYRRMVPQNIYPAWWGDVLMYQDSDEFGTIDPKTGKRTAIATVEKVNEAVAKAKRDKVSWLFYTEFPYADKPYALIANTKQRMLYDWKKNEVVWTQCCEGETHAEWNARSRAVAYVKNHQLFVRTDDNKETQLTTDGSREIVYGQSVHRDEFGIHKGTFWSNDGQKLAFYRMDQSMVADYPQVNTFEREATYEPDKYPMVGMTSHKVTVGVYDINTGKTVYLKAGDPTDRYFTNIAWAPDGKTVYMIELNRDQTDMALVSYNAETGDKTATLYTEHHDKYVHPMTPIMFLPWDATKFVMMSEKDGYNHAYLFNIKGKQLKQLTNGKWIVKDVIGFNKKAKSMIVLTTEASPIQNNIYSVNIANGKRTPLDNQHGVHAVGMTAEGGNSNIINASGTMLFDRYTEPDVPRNITVSNTANGKTTQIFSAPNPWEGYAVPEYSCGTLKAADGKTDLYYRMVKPVNFDPNKKYPTVVYVYGGPGVRNVEATWHYMSRGWETYMAQKGYLLFILDNRGSCDRGRDFEQATFRHLGVEEMKDQMKGVEYLKTLPYVDANRMGVHGWSYGGFMTTSLMTTYPDVFKVGVAGGPVIDWKWYEVMYGERYMDTPKTNPEGYEQTSLLNKAKNLKGKLQIIIGMNDPTVVPQHALMFLNACTEAGTQPDFFAYPGEGHNMMGHKSVHLHERITQYFEDYLK